MSILEAAPTPVTPSTWSLRTSFGLVVAAQVLLFAGSNLPTPLFPIYEHRYGFGSGVVTLLFGVYVGVLIPALMLLGPITDRIGRRPLLVAGIAVTTISSAIFAAARSVEWLFAGEIIYGIGSALVMACVSVAIRELHPSNTSPRPRRPRRSPWRPVSRSARSSVDFSRGRRRGRRCPHTCSTSCSRPRWPRRSQAHPLDRVPLPLHRRTFR